jgi:hypothetical protein
MVRSRFRLKALVLSGLVLCTMAFSATAAHAEKGANWRVNGVNVNATLLPKLGIELENKTASLSFTTKGGTGVLILCTAAEFDEGGQLAPEGVITLGRLLLKGCSMLLNEVAAPKCTPHSPGKPTGEILTEKGKGLIVLDKETSTTSDLVKITPENSNGETSKLLALFELGETCAIGESINIETTALGEGVWLKDCLGTVSFLEEKVIHLFEEGLNKIFALGQPAKIIGSANVSLVSAGHVGLKWSGKPA